LTPQRQIVIRPLEPGEERAFHDINIDWITRFFAVEKKDRETLENPRAVILEKGGAILMAMDGSTPIGCVALIAMSDGGFELAKMGVLPAAQGRGVGRQLVEGAIEHAREIGAKRLYLETNSSLGPALRLYSEAGFAPIKGSSSPYARCDVQMELKLD